MKRTITEDILTWSKTFVEKPSDDLEGLPVCPFAKKTREEGKLKIIEVTDSKDFLNQVVDQAKQFGKYDVVIVACADFYISADKLNDCVHALNKVFVREDVYLIASYPDDEVVDFLESADFEPFFFLLVNFFKSAPVIFPYGAATSIFFCFFVNLLGISFYILHQQLYIAWLTFVLFVLK